MLSLLVLILTPVGLVKRCRFCWRGRCRVIVAQRRHNGDALFWECRVCGGIRSIW